VNNLGVHPLERVTFVPSGILHAQAALHKKSSSLWACCPAIQQYQQQKHEGISRDAKPSCAWPAIPAPAGPHFFGTFLFLCGQASNDEGDRLHPRGARQMPPVPLLCPTWDPHSSRGQRLSINFGCLPVGSSAAAWRLTHWEGVRHKCRKPSCSPNYDFSP
jgi:hypothetical protein